MNESEWKGNWWKPESPNEDFPGTLRLAKNSLELEIHGLFDMKDGRLDITDRPEQYPVVHGVVKGRHVTLLNCTSRAGQMSFPGPSTTKLIASSALLGDALFDENPTFFKLSLVVQDLDQWIDRQQVGIDHSNNSIVFQSPVLPKAILPDGAEVELVCGSSFYTKGLSEAHLSLEYRCDVTLTNEAPLSEWLDNWAQKILSYFTLAFSNAPKYRLVFHAHGGSEGKVSVERLEGLRSQPGQGRGQQSHDFLFGLDHLCDFEHSVVKWFERAPSLSPVPELYCGYMESLGGGKLEWQFLTLAQTVEVYHRVAFGGHYLERKQAKALRRKLRELILTEVPAPHNTVIADKMCFVNDYTLRTRVEELLATHKVALEPLLTPPLADFPKAVVDARNMMTHQGQGGVAPADLFWMTLGLQALIESCLLTEIGLDPARTAERVASSPRGRMLRRHKSRLERESRQSGSTLAVVQKVGSGLRDESRSSEVM